MFAAKIKDKLSAVPELVTLLTGGIYEWEEVNSSGDKKNTGINRKNTPDAYHPTTGLLLPCLLVKGRAVVSSGGIADQESQTRSVSQVVECWLYTDRQGSVSTLESAVELIYVALEAKTVEGAVNIEWFNSIRPTPDRTMEDATQFREDYRVVGLRTPQE